MGPMAARERQGEHRPPWPGSGRGFSSLDRHEEEGLQRRQQCQGTNSAKCVQERRLGGQAPVSPNKERLDSDNGPVKMTVQDPGFRRPRWMAMRG